MRMLFALLVLLAHPASAEEEPPVPRSLSECAERIVSLELAQDSLTQAIAALGARYMAGEDPRQVWKDDDRLRGAYLKSQKELEFLKHSCREMMDMDQVRKGSQAFDRVLRGKGLGSFYKDLGAALAQKDFLTDVEVYQKRSLAVLLDADRVREEAWARWARKRRLRRDLAVAGLLLAAAALTLRRRGAPARLQTVPAQAALPAAAPAPGLLPGSQLAAGYRIVRELGQGLMGEVYEAVETASGRPAAIRRLREELHRSEKDVDRFLAEARRVAALRGPHTAELRSVFIEDGRIFLALELLSGKNLASLLEPRAALAPALVSSIALGAAAALDGAHEKGILHGDLKPSNIHVAEDGSVKVADFSLGLLARRILAKFAWEPEDAGPAYMAPEEELGSLGPAADVYSLGAVCYQMLSGRPPFPGPDFLKQKRGAPPEAVGGGFDPILRRALDPDPAGRYKTALEMARSLAASGPGAGVNPRS